MDSSISFALTAAFFFLILSSRYAIAFVRRTFGLTEDMSLVARTAIFVLVLTGTSAVL